MSYKKFLKEQCYLNGIWVDADNGATLTVNNPYNDETLGTIPCCGAAETQRAIDAAERALPDWKKMPPQKRAAFLQRWADLIDQHQNALATLMTLEQGKPLKEALNELAYANSYLRWFAEEAVRIEGDLLQPPVNNDRIIVHKQAIGVVGAITPWNFPAAMITRSCAPALAAGCTIVLKPSELTPYSAFALAALADTADFPAGVLNVITGEAQAIGATLCESSVVRKLSFTGSTRVGKLLMAQCADTVKKLSLELGGNAPFIVFDDADLALALEELIAAKFRNAGQACISANRIFIQDNVYEAFLTLIKKALPKLILGNGLNKNTTIGPLINQAAVDKINTLVNDAISKGAKKICALSNANSSPLHYPPTLLVELSPEMQIFHEEIFGPVVACYRFKTEEEAIKLANNSHFGLAAYCFTENIHRLWRVTEALEYGMVGANSGATSSAMTPFGGFKESGLGREGSKYGIDEYLEIKSVYFKLKK